MKSIFKRHWKTAVKRNIEGLDQGASVPFDLGSNLFFFKEIVWMFDTLKWGATVVNLQKAFSGFQWGRSSSGSRLNLSSPCPLSPHVSHWYTYFIFLTFSSSCLSAFAFVSAAGLTETAGVKGQRCCLRRGDNSSSPLIFMVLLLYCDSNLMTTLRLFDKWLSLSCSAQDRVVRIGQICVWAHCSTDVKIVCTDEAFLPAH